MVGEGPCQIKIRRCLTAEDKTQDAGQAVVEQPKTEQQLMKEMNQAVKSGDYKAVAKVAQELVKFQKAKEQAELDAKQRVLYEKTELVKSAITKALAKMVDAGDLDQADGIWYTHDFGEKLVTCRLTKTAPRAKGATSGGGGGKKFSVSTTELLEKFGDQEYKDGQTYKQAWEANQDKNWRYAIRESLLKKSGMIS